MTNRAIRRAAAFKRAQRDRNAVEPSAVLRPIIYSTPFTRDEAASLSVETRLAWQKLTSGIGTEPDFNMLANSSNVALIRAEQIGELAVETVLRAQESIKAMQARYIRTGKFGADAAALATVPDMLDFYDQLLELSTPLQMTDALLETSRRVKFQREQA